MRRKDLLALALLGALLFGWSLGTRDFWEPDEPDFALISREMLQSGDWIVPTRNGVRYAEKPPLLYWMVAGLAKATGTGINGWTARLPSAFCAVVTALALYLAGCRWLSRAAGLTSAVVLMTMPLWWWSGRWLMTDMPFACLVSLAMIGLARPLLEERAPAWWGFVFLGLAVLAKGPLAGALVVAGLGMAGLLLCRNPLRFPLRWIAGGFLVLAVAAPWYWLVYRQAGKGFLLEVLWRQNFRAVETESHAHGPLYYLPNLRALFPWVLPFLAAIPMAWKSRREKPALGLVLGWALGMLVLLSIPRVKQAKYLLPMLPGAALLAGWAMEECLALKRWTAQITMGVLAVLAGALLACAWLLPEQRSTCLGLAVAAATCAASLVWTQATGPALASFCLAAASLALPVADRFKSARPLAEAAVLRAERRTLAYYGDDLQAAYPYYADRRLDYIDANEGGGHRLEIYFRAHPDALVLMRLRDYKRLSEWNPALLVTLGTPLSRKVGGKDVVAAELVR